MDITANADGTYSWTSEHGFTVTSCVLPYRETFFDRTLVGYAVLSYSLWARTILRGYWAEYVGTPAPKWMQQAKPQRVTLTPTKEHS